MTTTTNNLVALDEEPLVNSGFTNSGQDRFRATITDIAQRVFERSVQYADADKAHGLDREVTHEHVRAATLKAIGTAVRMRRTAWQIGCNIGEYVCAVAAGVGGGYLTQGWGIAVFVLGAAIGVLLVGYRLFLQDRE